MLAATESRRLGADRPLELRSNLFDDRLNGLVRGRPVSSVIRTQREGEYVGAPVGQRHSPGKLGRQGEEIEPLRWAATKLAGFQIPLSDDALRGCAFAPLAGPVEWPPSGGRRLVFPVAPPGY